MKPRNIVLFFCILIFVSFCFSSEWQPQKIVDIEMKCFHETVPIQWYYCINKTRGSTSRNHLYYFHGRNGDETWWNDSTHHTGKIYNFWKESKSQRPIVISVSFGKLWLLLEKEDGLLNIFLKEVIETVERKIGTPEKRGAFGISMGGMNSLLLAFHASEKFSKIASLCSPLSPISPFSSPIQIYNYIRESSTSWKRAAMLMLFSRFFFKDESEWKNNDPISLASSRDYSSNSEIYITCGKKDEWGCYSASEKLVEILREKGVPTTWVPRMGGHCDIDHESVAQFLIQ